MTNKNHSVTTPFLVGIGGGTCSGKTSLARCLIEEIQAINQREKWFEPLTIKILSMDNFYKPLKFFPIHCIFRYELNGEEKRAKNFDHPDALDLIEYMDTLETLTNQEASKIPVYDFTIHDRVDQINYSPGDIIICEGLYALYNGSIRNAKNEVDERRIIDYMNYNIFMKTPLDQTTARRFLRDVTERERTPESISLQIHHTVSPMYLQYVYPTSMNANRAISWSKYTKRETSRDVAWSVLGTMRDKYC